MQVPFGTGGDGDIGTLYEQARLKAVHVALIDDVGAGCGDPDIAVDVNHGVAFNGIALRVIRNTAARVLKRNQVGDVQPFGIKDRTARVSRSNQYRPFGAKKSRRVHADGTETLHHDAGAGELEVTMSQCDLGDMTQTPTGGTDLIERDASDGARQAHGAADLIVHPSHAFLIGTHIGTKNIFPYILQSASECPDPRLLVALHHLRITVAHGLTAAVAQSGRGVLERHRAS